MTTSKTALSLLVRIRRTINRTLRKIHVASCTLTLSIPPFFKLEIKAEPRPKAKPRQRP